MNVFRKAWIQYVVLLILAAGAVYAWIAVRSDSPGVALPGHEAPAFQLVNLEGKKVALSDYKGQGIMINFWASWCNPCVNELPLLNEAYKLSGVQMLAVNVGEDAAAAQKFVERYELQFPIALDPEMKLKSAYKIIGLPLTVLIAPDGTVLERHQGELTDMADIMGLMNRLKEG
ncbi:redoxin domain-containing protein [Paenibacillus sp. 1011MAR3C5]|uniref:redoxin domain-containing protein n=1 Tax=Paenibacillus sp. 1011MAR3C5 TaxID=1675787 RepID=UPI0021756DE3|nr:redoxin domain-containing protein [Paenibacillus sp. 1011MAR3C5]